MSQARCQPSVLTQVDSASAGIAESLGCQKGTEDTITLLVDWQRKPRLGDEGAAGQVGQRGTAVYTASWTAPQKAGVHSQQNFHYVASRGEIRVDQAKRGYEVTGDETGIGWLNPFYMRYAPDEKGNFGGQGGYGYISFERFVDAVEEINDAVGDREKASKLEELDRRGLPTLSTTILTSAILEAGRKSLDERRPVKIARDASKGVQGWSLQ